MKAKEKDSALAKRIRQHIGALSWKAGNTQDEAYAKWESIARTLRRAQLTLRSWAEKERSGTFQHTDYGKRRPFQYYDGPEVIQGRAVVFVPDLESGALRRVVKACEGSGLHYFHKPDAADCVLFVGIEPLTERNYHTVGIPCI
jgi:hypothetical protein